MSHTITAPTDPMTGAHLVATGPTGDTRSFLATDWSSLYDVRVRGRLVNYNTAPAAYYSGDGRLQVEPITLQVLVEAATERDVVATIDDLVSFLASATMLYDEATEAYRALIGGGRTVARAAPEPRPVNYSSWTLALTLLPKFPRPTSTAAMTATDYAANLITGSWVSSSDGAYDIIGQYGVARTLDVSGVRDLGGIVTNLRPGQPPGADQALPVGNRNDRVRAMSVDVKIAAADAPTLLEQYYALVGLSRTAISLRRSEPGPPVNYVHRALLGDGASLATATLRIIGARDAIATLSLWPAYARPTVEAVTTLGEYLITGHVVPFAVGTGGLIGTGCTGDFAFSDGTGWDDGTCWLDD